MKDNPPDDRPERDAALPKNGRELIGLFDLRKNSIEDIVKAAVEAMKAAGL